MRPAILSQGRFALLVEFLERNDAADQGVEIGDGRIDWPDGSTTFRDEPFPELPK